MASKFQNKLKKKYEALGYHVILLKKTSSMGDTDMICVMPGDNVLFIESKEKTDRLSPIQKYRIDLLRHRGFNAEVIQDQ